MVASRSTRAVDPHTQTLRCAQHLPMVATTLPRSEGYGVCSGSSRATHSSPLLLLLGKEASASCCFMIADDAPLSSSAIEEANNARTGGCCWQRHAPPPRHSAAPRSCIFVCGRGIVGQSVLLLRACCDAGAEKKRSRSRASSPSLAHRRRRRPTTPTPHARRIVEGVQIFGGLYCRILPTKRGRITKIDRRSSLWMA